jgi:hypothetical protein
MSCFAGAAGGVGNAVVNVYINYEKKFAFVEVRSPASFSHGLHNAACARLAALATRWQHTMLASAQS